MRNVYQYHHLLDLMQYTIMTLIIIRLSEMLSFAFSYLVILNIVHFDEAFLLRTYYNDSQFHRFSYEIHLRL